jgi:hypothetical protein
MESGNASGFFVRKNKRLYLVTCSHVFTGLDSWSGNDKGPYDSIKVRYYDNEERIQFFTIKSPSDGFDFMNFKQDPDIHFYEVTGSLSKNAMIYSIEKFIDIARQKKSFDSRQLISFQFSRSEDDVIAEQVKSIMRDYEFSPVRNTFFPNSSFSDKVVFPNLTDQSENNIQLNGIPIWTSNLNNSLLGEQTLFKVDTVLPSIKDYGNSVINSDTSIFTFIIRDTLLFTNYFSKKDNLSPFEKSEPLEINSANINNEEPIWNKSFEKLLSTITSSVHQDSLGILTNFGETSLIGKNGYLTNFDSITNSLDFGAFKVNDSFLNTVWQKDELSSPVRNNSQYTPFLLPQIKFTDIDQLNKKPFIPPSLQDAFAQIDFTLFPPDYYTAEAVEGAAIGINDPKFYDNYFTIMPPSAPGGSGSPLFYICKGTINNKQVEWIEFAGMQCANINRSIKHLFLQEIQPLATIILKADTIIQELDLLK